MSADNKQEAEKVRQSVLFIWSVWSVWFVWLNETNQINKTDQINQMNQIDRYPGGCETTRHSYHRSRSGRDEGGGCCTA